MYKLLCCVRNPQLQLLSRRRKTPSLLFVHIEAFFHLYKVPLYSCLSRSFFVFNEAFCYHSQATLSFILSSMPRVMIMMVLQMSNECLYECKQWCDEICKCMTRTHTNHAQTFVASSPSEWLQLCIPLGTSFEPFPVLFALDGADSDITCYIFGGIWPL